jgi:hypothetical protein
VPNQRKLFCENDFALIEERADAHRRSADLFGFAPVEGREVVAAFDGGANTSDAGWLLLSATDRALDLSD